MTENQYKRKNTSVSLINYHFVFCPKRRKRVLVNEVSRKKEFPHLLKLPSLWTRSYYCGTAGCV
uniref:Transposase n=1 Tax=Planktothrix agardhii TaxID=1160 RepID=A0A1J1JF30_PLAAG|nr:transposase [Planktothrix agardhii]